MRMVAAVGALVWVALAGAAVAGALPWRIFEPLFLLVPLVLVPLALDLVDPGGPPRALRIALPGAALAAVASLALRAGVAAGALASVWLALTSGLAAWGAMRFVRRARADAAETAIDLGLAAVPVGGAWLVASRLGLSPLGFQEPIVLLTAIHFHFAAFVALVWTGCAARRLPASRARRVAVGGVAIGTPLLAAGITLAPWLELAGALVLAGSLGWLAVAVLRHVCPAVRSGGPWLRVSALSVLFSMPLAVAYAWGQVATPLVSLDLMARLHGTANALGFALCGLIGWTLGTARTKVPFPSPLHSASVARKRQRRMVSDGGRISGNSSRAIGPESTGGGDGSCVRPSVRRCGRRVCRMPSHDARQRRFSSPTRPIVTGWTRPSIRSGTGW